MLESCAIAAKTYRSPLQVSHQAIIYFVLTTQNGVPFLLYALSYTLLLRKEARKGSGDFQSSLNRGLSEGDAK